MTEKQEKEKLIGPHVNCVGLFKIFKTSTGGLFCGSPIDKLIILFLPDLLSFRSSERYEKGYGLKLFIFGFNGTSI